MYYHPYDEWTEVFGSERLMGVLLDRLTHHVHIIEMNGELQAEGEQADRLDTVLGLTSYPTPSPFRSDYYAENESLVVQFVTAPVSKLSDYVRLSVKGKCHLGRLSC